MKRISVWELRLALALCVFLVVVMLAAQDYLMAAIVTAIAVFGTTWQVRHGTHPISGVTKPNGDQEIDPDH